PSRAPALADRNSAPRGVQLRPAPRRMRAAREAVLLAAGCLALYLAGAAGIPFYTRGEPREGLVVREMLGSGEWLVPARPEGELARKPPLYYWAAAAALGALAKGPVALVLPALAAAGLRIARREVRPLRVAPVLGGAAVLAGLWYAAAFAREGSAFLDVVARENWLRFVDPEGAATGHAHA